MSGIGKAVFNTLNYVNPFSEGFKKDFAATKDWGGIKKWATYIASLILGLPFVIPGVLFFRCTVRLLNGPAKTKEKEEVITPPKEDPKPITAPPSQNTPSKIVEPEQMAISRKRTPSAAKAAGLTPDGAMEILKSLGIERSWGKWFKGGVKFIGEGLNVIQESKKRDQVEWKTRRYEGVVIEWKARILACNPQKTVENTNLENPMHQVLKVLEACEATFADEGRFDPKHIVNHRESVKDVLIGCIMFIRNQYRHEGKMEGLYRDHLDQLSYLFFESDLSQEMDYTLKVFNSIGEKTPAFDDCMIEDKELFGETDFLTGMEGLREKIEKAPQDYKGPLATQVAKNANGNSGLAFDPILDGNLPQNLYKIKLESAGEGGDGQRIIDVHALPTPTNEWVESELTWQGFITKRVHLIDPEFKGALRHGVKNGKKYLYVINQDILADGMIKNEKKRCDLLLALQSDPDLQGSFFCIALSKDSKFYLEGGSKKQKAAFKKELYDQISGNYEATGCSISETIKKECGDFSQFLDGLLNSLFDCYENEELTVEQRKAIIEQAYHLLTLALVDKLNANKLIVACKDTADRAGAANGQLYGLISLVQNGSFLEPEKNKIARFVQARAPFAKKRAIEKDRMDRVNNTFRETVKILKGFSEAFGKVIGNKKMEIVKFQTAN